MAIEYVGGVTGSRPGVASGSTTQSLTSLTGGIASAPAEGDLVVVWVSIGSAGAYYAGAELPVSGDSSGEFSRDALQSQTAATYDPYAQLSWQIQGATPDTQVTIPTTGGQQNAQLWTVQVFRGVDSSTPFDVTSVDATGTATGRPDPAAITPSTAGAWILWLGASAATTGAVYTAPTDFATNWLGGSRADSYDSMSGAGYYTGWTSGSYDPAAITAGGTANAVDSWVAKTVALRPAASAQTITGTLAATDAVDAFSSSGSLFHNLAGALAATEPADTLSASGLIAHVGSLAATENADTVTIGGTVGPTAQTITGSLSATEATDTFTIQGYLNRTGSFIVVEPADAFSATGLIAHVGNLAATDNADSFSASGVIAHVGSFAATESRDAFSATGAVYAVITGPLEARETPDVSSFLGHVSGNKTGTMAVTETPDTVAAEGVVWAIVGQLSANEPADTAAFNGVAQGVRVGTLAVVGPEDSVSFSGRLGHIGSFDILEAADTVDLAGLLTDAPIVGTLAITEFPDNFLAWEISPATLARAEIVAAKARRLVASADARSLILRSTTRTLIIKAEP